MIKNNKAPCWCLSSLMVVFSVLSVVGAESAYAAEPVSAAVYCNNLNASNPAYRVNLLVGVKPVAGPEKVLDANADYLSRYIRGACCQLEVQLSVGDCQSRSLDFAYKAYELQAKHAAAMEKLKEITG